jgi:hypothetical protein
MEPIDIILTFHNLLRKHLVILINLRLIRFKLLLAVRPRVESLSTAQEPSRSTAVLRAGRIDDRQLLLRLRLVWSW